jgi:hypothetical protein
VKASEVLLGAAGLVKRRGLHKGWFHDGTVNGPVCAVGAIRVAEKGSPGITCSNGLVESLAWVIDDALIGDWNDDRDRTADDVVVALDAAAVVALQEEGLEPEDVL